MKTKTLFPLLVCYCFSFLGISIGQDFVVFYEKPFYHFALPSQFQSIFKLQNGGYRLTAFQDFDFWQGKRLFWLDTDSLGQQVNLEIHDTPDVPVLSAEVSMLENLSYYWTYSHALVDAEYIAMNTAAGDSIWEVTLGPKYPSISHSANNSQEIWVGFSSAFSTDSVILKKFNPDGNEITHSLFPGKSISSIITENDGCFIERILSYSPYGSVNSIDKVDGLGDILWGFDTTAAFRLKMLAANDDGESILSIRDTTDKLGLIMLSPAGLPVWYNAFSDSLGLDTFFIEKIVAMPGGDFMVAYRSFNLPTWTLKIAHLRPDGSIAENWELFESQSIYCNTGVSDGPGSVLFAGFKGAEAFLVKLSPGEVFPVAVHGIENPTGIVQIYPNPVVSSEITISLPATSVGKRKVVMTDIYGSVFHESEFDQTIHDISIHNNIRGLAIVQIWNNGRLESLQKIIFLNP